MRKKEKARIMIWVLARYVRRKCYSKYTYTVVWGLTDTTREDMGCKAVYQEKGSAEQSNYNQGIVLNEINERRLPLLTILS